MSHIPDSNNDNFRVDFQKIREAAKATGMSVRDIASKAGVLSHATVANVLNGTQMPTLLNAKKICEAIGLPIEDVFIQHDEVAS